MFEGCVQMSEWRPQLHIPALPKAEYMLMREMCQRYNLIGDDGKVNITELFTVLLTLGYEVCQWGDGQGEQWLVRLIAEHRGAKEPRKYVWEA